MKDTDKDLARAYIRGDLDADLVQVCGHARPNHDVSLLEQAAQKHGILKIDGQRGITETGGLSLIGLLAADLASLPSYEEIAAR